MPRKTKMLRMEQEDPREKHIAIYRRVSTDRQADEGYSLADQYDRLTAYTRTMTGVAAVTDYVDDGYSGANLDRPGIQRLIEDVRAGKLTHVVVNKLDRLSRSQKDTLALIEDVLAPQSVAFISIQESFDTSTPFGRAVLGILSVFAQLERENIFARTRAGMQKRVESGLWPGGGNTPFCYDYDRALGKLVPNRNAALLRYAADRYLSGESTYQIAKETGIGEKTVYNMLASLTSCGSIVYNNVEYPGTHEAIISRETHNAIMDVMAGRSRAKTVTTSPHLLSGMVFCGKCGARMRYMRWGKKGFKLVCYSHLPSKASMCRDPSCDNPYPWAGEVEAGVVGALLAVSAETLGGAAKAVEGGSADRLVRDQLAAAERKLRRLYERYAEDDGDILLGAIGAAKEEVARLRAQSEDADAKDRRKQQALSALKRMDGLRDSWPEMTVQERRAILMSVVERVSITGEQVDIRLKYGLTA